MSVTSSDHSVPLEMYCETYDQLFCQYCSFTDHEVHQYGLVADVFQNTRKSLRENSQQLNNSYPSSLQPSKLWRTGYRSDISTREGGTTDPHSNTAGNGTSAGVRGEDNRDGEK